MPLSTVLDIFSAGIIQLRECVFWLSSYPDTLGSKDEGILSRSQVRFVLDLHPGASFAFPRPSFRQFCGGSLPF